MLAQDSLVVAPVRTAEGPKCGPVSDAIAANVGQIEARLDPHRAPGTRNKVVTLRLNASRGPSSGGALDSCNLEGTIAVQLQIVGTARISLNLPCSPVGRTSWVACARVNDPVGSTGKAVGGANEVVTPGQRKS